MSVEYLDHNGLSYFWGKLKAYVSSVLPSTTSDLTNDSGFITASDVPSKVYPTSESTALTSGTDLNSLAAGSYYCSGSTIAAGITNTPTTSTGYRLLCYQLTDANRKVQIAYPNSLSSQSSPHYERTYNGTSWTEWKQVLMTSKGSVNNSATKDINVPSSSSGIVILSSATTNSRGLFMVAANSSGTVLVTNIHKGSNVTITNTTNNMNVKVSSGTSYIDIISLYGSDIKISS